MAQGAIKDKNRDRKRKEKQEQGSSGIRRELLPYNEDKKKEFGEMLDGRDGKEIKGKTVQTIKMWFQSVLRLESPRMLLDVTQNVFLHS